MTEDFPQTADGEPDYEQAVEMLSLEDVSPRNPTFIKDGSTVHAVIGVDVGFANVVDPTFLGPQKPRDVELEALWNEWMNDELVYQKRTFHNVENDVYNTETHVAVPRLALATVIDEAAAQVPYLDGEYKDKFVDALSTVQEALGDE